jgi:undecaprenyl-diphosphatase
MNRLLELDAKWSQRMRVAEKPGALRLLAAFLAHSGDSWFWLLGLMLLYAAGDAHWRLRATVLGAGILVTAIVVLIIKFTVRRRRPEGEWGELYRKSDPHSFPSGHAVRAVMLSVVAIGLGPGWFGLVLAIWAPLVALARAAMGVHYLSDVLAGMVLGLVMGVLIWWFFDNWFIVV